MIYKKKTYSVYFSHPKGNYNNGPKVNIFVSKRQGFIQRKKNVPSKVKILPQTTITK